MDRATVVKSKASELIQDGCKPSASLLSAELDFTEADVHRCLNFLESRGEVETYTKEFLGRRQRLVGVKRDT